jgi:hypothetical protein
MITRQQLRWLLVAMASGLVAFVVVRQRKQLTAALPQPLMQQAERFVIPWSTLERRGTADPAASDTDTAADSEAELAAVDESDEDDQTNGDSMQRKVSRGYRISFGGKRYGPLPEALIGQYVDVETRGGKLFILNQGTPIATFDLQS